MRLRIPMVSVSANAVRIAAQLLLMLIWMIVALVVRVRATINRLNMSPSTVIANIAILARRLLFVFQSRDYDGNVDCNN